MRLNRHSEKLQGKHSFLSPSQPAWLRYDDQKLERRYMEELAAVRGTEEHEYAARAINLGHRQPEEPPTTVGMYINDSIGWRMRPEVILYWSDFCFGTADALGFVEKHLALKINDLKTGRTRTTFDQLVVYAALFCLEYDYPRPWELDIELRIYQSNRIKLHIPDHDEVALAMDRILTGTRLLEDMRREQLS